MKTYAIVGGSAAGVAAAKAIRKADPKGRILMYSLDKIFYTRCLLHKVAAGMQEPGRIIFARESLASELNIELNRDRRVEAADAKAGRLVLSGGESVPYDSLLVASGSSPVMPPVEGFNGKGVFAFRNVEDAIAIRIALKGARKVAVLGAGLAGCELAAELAHCGLDVSLVEMAPRPLPLQLDEEAGALCGSLLEKAGVKTICGEKVKALSRDASGKPARLLFASGSHVDCEILVCAAGVRPNSGMLAGSGVQFGERGGVRIDGRCATAEPNVFAAGDVTESLDGLTGRWSPSAIWPAAVRQGSVAGANMAGAETAIAKNTGLRTAFSLCGTSFVSLGPVSSPSPSWRKYVFKETDASGRKSLKVFYVDGDCLKGAIIAGDIAASGVYAEAIINRRPVGIDPRLFDSLEAAGAGEAKRSISD